jgi:hypothetical protein
MSTTLSARDVPELRARMAAWARDPDTDGAANWFTFFLGPSPAGATESRVFNRADNTAAVITNMLAAQLPAAELFYVSSNMTELARHAATTLTDYRLHPEDLPAPIGLMVYAHPPVDGGRTTTRHESATMVSWGPGRGGLHVHTWASASPAWARTAAGIGRLIGGMSHEEAIERARHGNALSIDDLTAPDDPAVLRNAVDHFLSGLLPNLQRAPVPPSVSPVHGYEWCGLTPMEFTNMQGWPDGVARDGENGEDSESRIALQRTVLATWLLMGQTLVRSEPLAAPRPARRRIARIEPTLNPTVRYIDLRRARTEPAEHTDNEPRTGGRTYRHRWIVRGLNRTLRRVTISTVCRQTVQWYRSYE